MSDVLGVRSACRDGFSAAVSCGTYTGCCLLASPHHGRSGGATMLNDSCVVYAPSSNRSQIQSDGCRPRALRMRMDDVYSRQYMLDSSMLQILVCSDWTLVDPCV